MGGAAEISRTGRRSLFGAMLDLGVVQNSMFGSGVPPGWGAALPGYGPGHVIVDAAFSDDFHAWGALALSLAWTLVLAVAVLSVLGRLVGMKDHGKGSPTGGRPKPSRSL